MEHVKTTGHAEVAAHGALKAFLGGIAVLLGLVVLGLGTERARLWVAEKQLAKTTLSAHLPAVPTKSERGSLMICGGGKLPDDVRDYFVALAGGAQARLVLVPTAHNVVDAAAIAREVAIWKSCGAGNVEVFHTRSRVEANDPNFIKPLAQATGVWFGGGKQALLSEAYCGTLVEKQLKEILNRGGVVGGTSAGAAVLTRVMIAGGREEAVEGTGFDLLPGSVVDQHFMQRNRFTRLLGLLSRHPGLIGFGIDESTALVVRGEHLSVMGKSYVLACLPGTLGNPVRFQVLKGGDQTEISSLRENPVAITSAIDFDELAGNSEQ
jgi:cyanophycinase